MKSINRWIKSIISKIEIWWESISEDDVEDDLDDIELNTKNRK